MAVQQRNDDSAPVEARAEEVAGLLRALGNRHRLLILCHLLQVGEASAGELARHLGLGDSSLSQHLKRMREQRLVACRRQARTMLYRIDDLGHGPLKPLLRGICAPIDGANQRASSVQAALALALGKHDLPLDAGDWQFPAITTAGPVQAVPEAACQPDPNAEHKLVFTLGAAAPAPAEVHPGLVRLARTVNLYALAGVPRQRLHCVAVLAADACEVALGDRHYRPRHDVANPNLPLLRELDAFGVRVLLCGQTLAARGYPADALDASVHVALSALTTVADLQHRGHALMAL